MSLMRAKGTRLSALLIKQDYSQTAKVIHVKHLEHRKLMPTAFLSTSSELVSISNPLIDTLSLQLSGIRVCVSPLQV